MKLIFDKNRCASQSKHKSNSLIPAFLPLLLITGVLVITAQVRAQQSQVSAESKAPDNVSQESKPGSAQKGLSTVRGRVIYADSRRPLRRAEVTLFETGTGMWKQTAATDRRGLFTFENVPAGAYFILADAPGIISPRSIVDRSGSLLNKIMLGEIKDGFSEVAVDGKSNVETEVRVRRGGVITGRVTTEDDEPIAKADIKLFKRERGRFVQVESTWQALDGEKQFLQTDARGVYRIAGLPAGEYVVRVSEAEISADHVGDETEAYGDGSLVITYYPSATSLKDAQAVTVLEGNESTGIDVRMPSRETHKIAGTVTVGRDGEPAGHVEIKIDRKDEGLPRPTSLTDVNTRANQDGNWEVNGIPDGEYVLTIGAGIGVRVGSPENGGWISTAPQRLTVKVAGANVTGLDVQLNAGGSVSGKVSVEGRARLSYDPLRIELMPAVDGHKTPAPSTAQPAQAAGSRTEKASAQEDLEEVDRTFVRDESGDFEMDGVPAGRYYLRVRGIEGDRFYVKAVTRNGIDLMRSSFKVDEGMDFAGIQVTLATDVATIEGRVNAPAAAGKAPSPAATVVLIPADEAGRRFVDGLMVTRADNLGRFTLKSPPGEYFIAAFIRQQTGNESVPINEDYLKRERSKFRRLTLRPGEQVKALDVPVINN